MRLFRRMLMIPPPQLTIHHIAKAKEENHRGFDGLHIYATLLLSPRKASFASKGLTSHRPHRVCRYPLLFSLPPCFQCPNENAVLEYLNGRRSPQDVTVAGAPAACRVDTTFSIMKVAPSSCSSHRLVRGRARGWGRQWHLVGGEGPKGWRGRRHPSEGADNRQSLSDAAPSRLLSKPVPYCTVLQWHYWKV